MNATKPSHVSLTARMAGGVAVSVAFYFGYWFSRSRA